VEGVYEKDPKIDITQNMNPIEKLSYEDLKKYSNPNRPLVHSKTVQPLKEKNIILRIRKFNNINSIGSIIF